MSLGISDFDPVEIEKVLEIERQCFQDCWPRSAFLSEVGKPWSWFRLAYMEEGKETVVAGYVVAWLLPQDMHILNLAVRKEFRRRGIATSLVEDALEEFGRRGGGMAYLEVRQSNNAARRVYEKLGFRCVGRRPRYYRVGNEDALLMALRVGGAKGEEKDDQVRRPAH
ncbi:MAG: ribosomal-protein-alanine N-acetyltransferase [Deltaproteobacteria bacterium]|nr:MAG: ribosomal-protein-alanine N-acetyltransferase [Deltaproteobacteria bacterium]